MPSPIASVAPTPESLTGDQMVDPPQRSKGLTQAYGLSTLAALQKQVEMDGRRTGANIALNHSMTDWMAHKATSTMKQRDGLKEAQAVQETEDEPPKFNRLNSMCRRSVVSSSR